MAESASFFVSYTGVDARWAEWIAWQLEKDGYKVTIQAWDFRPGSNFVLEMQKAASECDRTLIVLSPAFLKSVYTAPEWAAAFVSDPTCAERKLLPVRVVECEPEGLLKPIVSINLVGLDEAAACKKLLEGVKTDRAKPSKAPAFPSSTKTPATSTRSAPSFPGGLPPLWTVPFPHNPHFTGREQLLDDLRQGLTEKVAAITQPRAVHGLGGVGKTQLAVEYAWKYQSDYDAVLWVVADSPENAAANLASLSRPDVLNLPEAEAKEQAVQVDAVRRWLREHHRWLLVFDSVDSREAAAAVRNLLAPVLPGHIIITSRRTDWPVTISALPVDSLPIEEATDFLCNRTRITGFEPGPRADAFAIARELDGLPLALEQAAAYILRHRVTFAVYLERLKQNRAQLLKEEAEGATRYPKSVAETWLVSEQQLSLAARAILRLAAFLASDDIPRALFTEGSKTVLKAIRALAAERKKGNRGSAKPRDIEAGLVELADHSLITLTPKAFSCHRLMQAVQGDRLTDKLRRRWIELALQLVDDHVPAVVTDVRLWPVMEYVRAHAEMIVGHADRLGIPKPTARLLNQLGLFLNKKALYREAEPLMRRALAIDEQSYGPEHPDVAIDLNNLAALLQDTNRLAEAEPLMRRALTIDEQSYGPEHPHVARDLNNLAQLLKATNRLAEAEPLMRRALTIDEQSYGPEHPHVAIDLNNLAQLLKATNRLAEAEPLMQRHLVIFRKFRESTGHEHPRMQTAIENYVRLLKAMGLSEEEIRRRVREAAGK